MNNILLSINTDNTKYKNLASDIKKLEKLLKTNLSQKDYYRFQESTVLLFQTEKINLKEYRWLTKLAINGALEWTESRVDYGFEDWLAFMFILRNAGLAFNEKIYQEMYDFWNSKQFIQLAKNHKVIAEIIVHLINNFNFEYQTFYSKLPKTFFYYLLLTTSKNSAKQFVSIKNYLQKIETILEISILSDKHNIFFLYALLDSYSEFCKAKNKENFYKKINNWYYFFNNILLDFPKILSEKANSQFAKNHNKLIDYYVYITIKKKLPVSCLIGFSDYFMNVINKKSKIKPLNNWLKVVSNQFKTIAYTDEIITHWLNNKDNYANFTKNQIEEIMKFAGYFKKKKDIWNSAAMYSQAKSKSIRKIKEAPKYLSQEELLKFLFVAYEMPDFMLKNITRLNNKIEQSIFFLIAKGDNLSKHNILPFNVTKREAHLFINFDNNLPSIDTALKMLIHAKILVNNGDSNFTQVVTQSQIMNHLDDMPFWETFFKFYGTNKTDMGYRRIRELIDYIIFKRYNDPQTENFSLKGKTVVSIIRQTVEWHLLLHRSRNKYINIKWNGLKKPNLYFDMKSNLITDKNKIEKAKYIIKQMISGEELAKEGLAQKHCVASYAKLCVTKQVSIWSLREIKGIHKVLYNRMITIEIANNKIVQARGIFNRLPNDNEKTIIKKWALKQNFILVQY